jgi:hypothetical protein
MAAALSAGRRAAAHRGKTSGKAGGEGTARTGKERLPLKAFEQVDLETQRCLNLTEDIKFLENYQNFGKSNFCLTSFRVLVRMCYARARAAASHYLCDAAFGPRRRGGVAAASQGPRPELCLCASAAQRSPVPRRGVGHKSQDGTSSPVPNLTARGSSCEGLVGCPTCCRREQHMQINKSSSPRLGISGRSAAGG